MLDQNLDDLFWELKSCRLESEKRERLSDLRDTDAQLADRLEQLLEADAKLGGFMQLDKAPDATVASETKVTDPADIERSSNEGGRPSQESCPTLSKQIGPYRLLEPIGEGGMGVVYLAQQSKPVRRKVAIKIIKPGMDSRQLIARFEAERQALAMMEHPNIAKVLDAGATDSGLPYFVMELVRGIPITDYCDRSKMTIRQRLELFNEACSAIQHAHNKGIIHRDIKPSNVLVTENDGTPLVKVIDFGVAKALTNNLTDKTMYTGVFQMIGTPLYMSPEQASLSNVDVDTRSDVYSLGVLLYELITGVLPIDRASVNKMSFEQLRRHIEMSEPLKPSRRLSTLKKELETIAERRGLDVNRIRREASSELDWIVMRAMEKDRHRRYQAPLELADDIQRLLAGHAVEACPPNWSYRAGKFVQRYRTGLIVSLIVLCSMSMATIVSISQAIRATRASEEADQSLQLAEARMTRLSEILYSQDMRSATRKYLAGNHLAVRRILARNRSSERTELRGYEWYFVHDLRPVQTEVLYQSSDRINDLVLTNDRVVVVGDSSDRIACVNHSTGRELAAIDAGVETVHDLEICPDGRIIAAGDSGRVHIFQWDASQRTLMLDDQMSMGERSLLSVRVSSDGATAFVGSDDGWIHWFEPQSGETLGSLKLPKDRAIRDLEFSKKTLLVAYDDALAGVFFDHPGQPGDVSGADWILAPNATMEDVRDIEVSDDGSSIVFAQLKGLITLVKNGPNPSIEFSQLMPNDVHSVAISPEGQWVAVGDSAGHLHLLPTQMDSARGFLDSSTSRARRVRSWKAHQGKVEQLRFVPSRNGRLELLSGGRDGALVISRPFESNSISFHSLVAVEEPLPTADAKCLALWGKLVFKAPRLGAQLTELEHSGLETTRAIGASGSGEFVALLDEERLVRFAPSPSAVPQVLWEAPVGFRVQQAAISTDGRYFALCVLEQEPRRHRIEVYELGRSTPLCSITSNLANDMVFSPSGRLLAYVWNNDIVLLDVATGQKQHLLRGHSDSIQGLAVSPDGTLLASVSSDRQLMVWDLSSGTRLWSQQAHQNRAEAVCFHPTLSTIATVGADATIRFWSSRHQVAEDSVRLVGEFPLDVGACSGIAFSADGRSLFIQHVERGVTELRAEIE